MSMGGPIYHLRNPLAADCSPLYDSYDSGYFCEGCRKWHEELVALLNRSRKRLVQIDTSMGGFNFANASLEDDIRDHLDYRKKAPCLKHKPGVFGVCEICGFDKNKCSVHEGPHSATKECKP